MKGLSTRGTSEDGMHRRLGAYRLHRIFFRGGVSLFVEMASALPFYGTAYPMELKLF
jgi:hypothetical protein